MSSGNTSALLRDWGGRPARVELAGVPGKGRNKYGAKAVTVAGVRYDSKAEQKRHKQLLLLEQMGDISALEHQVSFELLPGVRFNGSSRMQPAMRYVADFVYLDKRGAKVIEDVKGVQTPAFKIKRHMMLALLGLDIHIVKVR